MSLSHFIPVVGGYSPATHSERPMRGELLFDANFESGNLDSIEKVDEMEYELKIRSDTNAEKHSVWFYFRVSNVRRNQRVTFHINNYSKRKSLFRDGFTPVVRSTSRPTWERIPTKQVWYFRCNKHAPRHCISISFQFDRETAAASPTPSASASSSPSSSASLVEEEYFFAYSFPYTYSDLQRYLNALDSKYIPSGIMRHDLLTKTVQGRRVDLLCITAEKNMKFRTKDGPVVQAVHQTCSGGGTGSLNSSNPSSPFTTYTSLHTRSNSTTSNNDKSLGAAIANAMLANQPNNNVPASSISSIAPPRLRCVFLTARVHPGESPSSYVLTGFLNFLLSNDPIAMLLREHCVFYIIPMLNPDGVALGNYRCDSLGHDLNRCWLTPTGNSHPSILAAKSMLYYLGCDSKELALDYFIDIHAHTSALNNFFFCNEAQNPNANNNNNSNGTKIPTAAASSYQSQSRIEELPRLLDAYTHHFSFSSTKTLTSDIKEKMGTGRKAMGDFLWFSQTLCYTLEISFFCSLLKAGTFSSNTSAINANGTTTTTSAPGSRIRSQPYTQLMYLEIGKSIAWTFHIALKLNQNQVNQLSPPPSLIERPPFVNVNQKEVANSNSGWGIVGSQLGNNSNQQQANAQNQQRDGLSSSPIVSTGGATGASTSSGLRGSPPSSNRSHSSIMGTALSSMSSLSIGSGNVEPTPAAATAATRALPPSHTRRSSGNGLGSGKSASYHNAVSFLSRHGLINSSIASSANSASGSVGATSDRSLLRSSKSNKALFSSASSKMYIPSAAPQFGPGNAHSAITPPSSTPNAYGIQLSYGRARLTLT